MTQSASLTTRFPLVCSLSGLCQTKNKKAAAFLTERLKNAFWKGTVPEQAGRLIAEGRDLCKKFSRNYSFPEAIELDRYINALALKVWPRQEPRYYFAKAEPKAEFGLSASLAARHPDLVDFNRQYAIRAPRAHFGHQAIELRAGQPLLHFEGRMVPWDLVKKRIFGHEAPTSMRLPSGWRYEQSGLVAKDLINWTKLEPSWKIENPTKEFFLEVVSNEIGTKHSWVRLIDRDGNVISVGFASTLHTWFPLRSHIGKLASPDPLEFSGSPQHCLRYPISPKQYHHVKARIERDQNEGNLYFSAISRNCSTYVAEILEEIGIQVDTCEYPNSMLVRETSRIFGLKIPPVIRKIFLGITYLIMVLLSPILQVMVLFLGGSYKDKALEILEKTKDAKWKSAHRRPFSSVKSIFNGSNISFSTGWKMSEWQKSQKNCQSKNIPVTPWNQRKAQKG